MAGVHLPAGTGIFSFELNPDWPWGPCSLLSNGYQCYFPRS